jgi:hypothetical protein
MEYLMIVMSDTADMLGTSYRHLLRTISQWY